MFHLKSLRFFRATTEIDCLNFTRIRELRRIVKSFEPLSDARQLNEATPNIQQLPPDYIKNVASSNTTNPFRSDYNAPPQSEPINYEEDFDVAVQHPKQVDISYPRSSREALPSPLDPVDPNDPPDLVANFPPTFNLAAYVDKSETLQQLIKLGVDLSKIEKRKGLPQFLLKLDFEKDMKQHLVFLTDLGIPASSLGEMLTKNPLIFKEDIGDLEVRINYLEAKKFKKDEILRIVEKNPFWLMFPTKRIDKRLGHFQNHFELSGNEVRFLASKQPRLITYNMEHIRKNTFTIHEEMGFDKDETRNLLLSKPKLWMMDSKEILDRFNYIHNTMNLTHNQIIQCPDILTSRLYRLKQRHGFLDYLGKAQYDPNKELYVALKRLVAGTDKEFVIDVAKSSMEKYNTYLRTL